MEEKQFAILTKESVRLMAEAAGHTNLPEDVALLLGEDPVCGYGAATDPMPFRQTREGELHFVEDVDINLNNVVFSSYIPKHLGRASIKAHWMAVEGVSKSAHSNQTLQVQGKAVKKELPEELMQYYNQITKALVGGNTAVVKLALSDLATNANILPLLPFFVNFVANGVKSVSHDISKMTLLMYTVDSIVRNQAVFLEPQPYAVEYCLLEPLAASINPLNDHWMLRDYAARLLACIWSSPMNHLMKNTVRDLTEALQDLSRPFSSHYGATMGIAALGPKEVEEVLLPLLPAYWPHLMASVEDFSPANALLRADAHKVQNALLPGNLEQGPPNSNVRSALRAASGNKNMVTLYQQLSEYFGDQLAARLPVLDLSSVFQPQPLDERISLSGADSHCSGEALLATLMEEVKKQQQREEQLRVEQEQALAAEREKQRQQKQLEESARKNQLMRHSYMLGQDSLAGYIPGQHSETLPDQIFDYSESDLPQPSGSKWDASDNSEEDSGQVNFCQSLAVSTISDPSKGTLKLKISKRQMGQGSPQQSSSQPRLTLQINKSRTETDRHHTSKDSHQRESRHKHKRRQHAKSQREHESTEILERMEIEDSFSLCLPSLPAQMYSPSGESSGSDTNPHRKPKLTLKLKVPSKDSASE
ncbi:hypothetical protein C0Q70_13764 [Pomacea canaliculata]|uniref:TAF6 C-terminal HEAT repeat domain-containing protein n=1 Tax=Pomacea canaliculata TaxID=400727 RepID=A0A2T7NY61_POMCA|nr:hypothetical protein C0Q70_13764 [Pomacea canaliculata]